MDLGLDKRELFIIGIIVLLFFAWTIGNMSSAYLWISEGDTGVEDEIIVRKQKDYIFTLDIDEYEEYIQSGPVHPDLRDRFEEEDIELDEYLFRLTRRIYYNYLENGTISEDLVEDFEEEGLEIDEDAQVVGYDEVWSIMIDGEIEYQIHEIDADIDVYRINSEIILDPDTMNWYLYIEDDREYKINIDRNSYQFSIPRRDYEGHLQEGNISSRLASILEEGGIAVDEETQLRREEKGWYIDSAEEDEYWLTIEDNYIDVYKEEIKVSEYSYPFLQNLLSYMLPVIIIASLAIGAIVSPPDTYFGHIGRVFIAFSLIAIIYFGGSLASAGSMLLSAIDGLFPNIGLPSLPDISFGNGLSSEIFTLGTNVVGMILLGIITGVLLIFLFYSRSKKLSSREGTEKKSKETLSDTAERAIRQLHEGEDIKDVIIRNYQRMSFKLEEQGVEQKTSFTPREFEREALGKLPLKKKTIDEMTKLFEKAKYSHHMLDEKHRDRAIKNFKQIKKDIEGEKDEIDRSR